MSSVSNTRTTGTAKSGVTMAECLGNAASIYAAWLVEREAQTRPVAA